jgi:UDP-3-O-[3-hydroxymyristoyl] glucosamine N-acyltransferase
VHPSAVVTHTAVLEEGVVIGPQAYVASHARIGAGAVVVRKVRPGQTMFAAPARVLSDQ